MVPPESWRVKTTRSARPGGTTQPLIEPRQADPEQQAGHSRELPAYTGLRVRGLMTLALFTDDTDRVRECFRVLRRVRDQ
ncbi:MAG: hypothetical protein ACK5LN_00800, partial [Propioniciclava sp.]